MRIMVRLMVRTAVFGASGYAGGELVKLVDGHHGLDLVYLGAHSHAGGVLGEVHPQIPTVTVPSGPTTRPPPERSTLPFSPCRMDPRHRSVKSFADRGVKVVDLGSDFRFDSVARYEEAYGSPHPLPAQLGNGDTASPSSSISPVPTGWPRPVVIPPPRLLAIAPLLKAGADRAERESWPTASRPFRGRVAVSRRTSCLGRWPKASVPTGLPTHRHRPEIEMALDNYAGTTSGVTFTPHLVPIQRGLLATVTARLTSSDADPVDLLQAAYDKSLFVEVIDRPPQTRWVAGSNRALVAAFVDRRQGVVIVQCAIDNLLKGAAGQAVQAANIIFGLDEGTGLPTAGWMP